MQPIILPAAPILQALPEPEPNPEPEAPAPLLPEALPEPEAVISPALPELANEFNFSDFELPLVSKVVSVVSGTASVIGSLYGYAAGGLGYLGRATGLLSSAQPEAQQEQPIVPHPPEEPPLAAVPQPDVLVVNNQEQAAAAPIPSPIVVPPANEQAEHPLNFTDVSDAHVKAFRKLLPTLHTASLVTLGLQQTDLENTGKVLADLHPLIYFHYVIKHMKAEFMGILNRWQVGSKFRTKTCEALKSKKQEIVPHIEDFAQSIGKAALAPTLKAHAEKDRWSDFISLCIL